MFMNSNVKNFTIHIPDFTASLSSNPLVRPFFDDVAARMPGLTSLNLQTNIPMNALEPDVVGLLESLSNLNKLILPRFCFTTRIAECVSKLAKLGCIEFHYSEEQGTGDPNDIAVFSPELSEGAFSSLWDISLTTTFGDLQRFLTIPFSSSSITMLYVESSSFETPSAIHQLLTAVSENCQMLKLLTMISPRRAPAVDVGEEIDASQRVRMDTLKPLLACANLTSFEIIHQHPLLLKQEDVEILATRWPSLETLNLNSEPLNLISPELTLEALLPFAQHCDRLSALSVFLDASTDLIPSSSSLPFPVFSNLKKLSMGVSKLTGSVPPAIFLSQILPLRCVVESGVTWEESFEHDDPGLGEILAERADLWSAVRFLVPTLVFVRLEERERMVQQTQALRDVIKTLTQKVKHVSTSKDIPL
jgi:hypothetical protein